MPDPNVPDRSPGGTILAGYANDVRNRVAQRYATNAQRTVNTPTPDDGELSYVEDTTELSVYDGAGWKILASYNDDPAVFLGVLEANSMTIAGTVNAAAFTVGPGTVGIPSIRFSNDGNTGFYNPGGANSNSIAIATSGVLRFAVEQNLCKSYANPESIAQNYFDDWENYGGSFSTTISKDIHGYVQLEGLIRNNNGSDATGSTFEQILLLPAGARPPGTRRFNCWNSQNVGLVVVDVLSSGIVEINSGTVPSSGGSGWFNTAPLRFFAGWS